MDFANAQLPSLKPLQNSFAVDDVENDLRNMFIDLFEKMMAAQAFDANVLGAAQLGSLDLVRKMVNTDGLVFPSGDREETATRYLYKAWKSRNNQGRGFYFLQTYLQLLFPNATRVEQLAQAKAVSYPTRLTPAIGSDSTNYWTSRIRVSINSQKTTWAQIDSMVPVLISILPARFILHLSMLAEWRQKTYIGAVMLTSSHVTVYPVATQPATWFDFSYVGASLRGFSNIKIYPKA